MKKAVRWSPIVREWAPRCISSRRSRLSPPTGNMPLESIFQKLSQVKSPVFDRATNGQFMATELLNLWAGIDRA